jgi:integrase
MTWGRPVTAGRCRKRSLRALVASWPTRYRAALSGKTLHAEAMANKTATRRRRMVEKRAEAPIAEGVDYPTKVELRCMLAVSAGEVRSGQRPNGRIGPCNRVLLHFVVATGRRASELRGLGWKHLDLDLGIVTIEQRADRWNEIGAPKSSAGRRTIPLDRDMVQMLKEWRLRCPGAAPRANSSMCTRTLKEKSRICRLCITGRSFKFKRLRASSARKGRRPSTTCTRFAMPPSAYGLRPAGRRGRCKRSPGTRPSQ